MNQSKTGKLFSTRTALCSLMATAALVSACGGSSIATDPDFEYVSVKGVNGVRDNRTGMVWARALGSPDPLTVPTARLPAAAELLRLVDGTSQADLQQYFGFALGANPGRFLVAESNQVWGPGSVWTVDVAGVRIGGTTVRGAISADPNPYTEWSVLEPGTPTITSVSYARVGGLGVVTSGSRDALMWKLCPEGAAWNRTSQACTGTPALYSAAQAEQVAAAASATQSEGYPDWRLPTKEELQSLLRLDATARPAILSPFVVGYDQATPWATPFWTSSPSAAGFRWVVHFNDGAVAYTADTSTDEQHVRLVRISR